MEISDSISSVLNQKNNQLWTTEGKTSVFDAIQTMSDRNVGALPVIDSSGKPIGIVSERDYTRKVILEGKSSKKTKVEEIMTTDLVTVSPWDTVEASMHMMTEQKVRHLPVVEDGKMSGIVTIGDLVKWTISAQGAMIDHLEGYIRGTYPG